MSRATLAPNGSSGFTGTLPGGGGTLHGALSDSSDGTYALLDPLEEGTLTFADFTQPAGSVIIGSQLFLRCLKSGVGTGQLAAKLSPNESLRTFNITWQGGYVDLGTDGKLFPTDAEVDASSAYFIATALDIWIAKAWVSVYYWVKPTATVGSPTGTITSNAPTVSWLQGKDAENTASQSQWEVKIFSAAQYGAGGFDPETSTPTVEGSDTTPWSLGQSWDCPVALPDGTYRAYVKLTTTAFPQMSSDWDYEQFTVDSLVPGDPDVALTPVDASGKITVALTDTAGDGGTDTDQYQLQRSDDGGATYANVRTALGDGMIEADGSGDATIDDYEAPNGVTVYYRARAYDETQNTYSDWTVESDMLSSDQAWIKHPTQPALNLAVTLRSYSTANTAANQGTFRPLGSPRPVMISDVRGGVTGEITVLTNTRAERDQLAELLDTLGPFLLQAPVGSEIPDRWVVFGDQGGVRIVDKSWAPYTDETLPWSEVDRPLDPLA